LHGLLVSSISAKEAQTGKKGKGKGKKEKRGGGGGGVGGVTPFTLLIF